MATLYFLISLVFLFFTKKWLISILGKLVHRFGGSRHSLIVMWSVLFLPGTVIHELSHFFFAILTGARTGKIEILPEYLEEEWEDENEGGSVALGYVQTQRLNPIQGFFVGNAPFIIGLILLIWIASLIRMSFSTGDYLLTFLQGYLFFTIANSFFPSWPDIKQTIPLIILSTVFVIIFWTVGLRFYWLPMFKIDPVLYTISATLLVSSAINIILIGILSLVRRLA